MIAKTPRPSIAAFVAAMAVAGMAHTGVATADESALPPDTVTSWPHPRYLPSTSKDEALVRRWATEMVARGKARAGTRLGGDMLWSAAKAIRSILLEFDEAAAAYRAALATYPEGDVSRGIVAYEVARRETDRGHHGAAARALAEVMAWVERRAPSVTGRSDAEKDEAQRWRQLHEMARMKLPLLRADIHKAHGRFGEAADILRTWVEGPGRGKAGWERARLWERIARIERRANRKAETVAALEASLALTERDRDRIQRETMLLYARHGLLHESGAVGVFKGWPGTSEEGRAFEDDLRGWLRGVQGNPHAGTYLLMVASSAKLADKPKVALDIYLQALRDIDLGEKARHDPRLYRGLLVAFPIAMELERFDDAARILDAVARIADEPIAEMDAYRVELREARAEAAERMAREALLAGEAEQPETEAKKPEPPRGRPLGIRPEGDPGEPQRPEGVEPAREAPGRLWIVILIALAALAAVWRLARRS